MAEFDRIRIVLVGTRNPLNIGAAARAMSNFGILRLRVVNPYEASFREARSAVGACELLASTEQYNSVAEAVADCTLVVGTTAARHRVARHPLRRLEEGMRLIRKELASGCVAILFGSEKVGLGNEELSHCHWMMRIPTREEHMSMNLGQAVAVCPTAGQVERITAALLEALRTSGYMNPRCADATEAEVRRLVRRLHLRAGDEEVWLGMLRQILWKLRSEPSPNG